MLVDILLDNYGGDQVNVASHCKCGIWLYQGKHCYDGIT